MSLLVAIVGPTAVGKSALALRLAQVFGGEIVNADSRQVYRLLDIGTAKPSQKDQQRVPHHLIDVVNPDQEFSLALYQQRAYEAIQGIHQRGRLPFLVGGSGLYIWTVVEGLRVPQVPPNWQRRRELESQAAANGGEALYHRLQEVDPKAAARIDRRNLRRVIRALEVWETTGLPFSSLQHKMPPPFCSLIIGLTTERADLYRRIDERVDPMIQKGLVEEVRSLLARGYGLNLPALSGLGYRQIGRYLQGELDLNEAVRQIKVETHRFARQQYAWFRLKDPRIRWFDVRGDIEEDITQLIRDAKDEIR